MFNPVFKHPRSNQVDTCHELPRGFRKEKGPQQGCPGSFINADDRLGSISLGVHLNRDHSWTQHVCGGDQSDDAETDFNVPPEWSHCLHGKKYGLWHLTPVKDEKVFWSIFMFFWLITNLGRWGEANLKTFVFCDNLAIETSCCWQLLYLASVT